MSHIIYDILKSFMFLKFGKVALTSFLEGASDGLDLALMVK